MFRQAVFFSVLWSSQSVWFASPGVASANPQCRGPGGTFSHNTQLQLSDVVATEAPVCNDGSPAKFYYRPCCDGQDPLDFCNASNLTNWFIVFEGNNGWCFSKDSCELRMRASPSAVSSVGLPKLLPQSLDGIFSIAGEQNPNFYKSYAAYIPHCSSDLFLSSCRDSAHPTSTRVSQNQSSFCGRDVAMEVVKSLVPDMQKYGATNVVFVGGAGIMQLVPELAALLPSSSTPVAVCDG